MAVFSIYTVLYLFKHLEQTATESVGKPILPVLNLFHDTDFNSYQEHVNKVRSS